MALITFDDIRSVGRAKYAQELRGRTAASVLESVEQRAALTANFDVFLSHSYQDRNLDENKILETKGFLEDFGYSVYVDWYIDRQLNRDKVTSATATLLRTRMDHCRCLLFVVSSNSSESKWMPWELGYKDGNTGKNSSLGQVAIVPLVKESGRYEYNGVEYLGIYPYVTVDNDTEGIRRLWIHADSDKYVTFEAWLNGTKPYKRN